MALPKFRGSKRDRPTCSVPNCVSNTVDRVALSGLTFHVFPSNPTTRNLWVSWLKIPGFVPNKGSRICSKHFSLDSYQQNISLLESFGLDTPLRMRLQPGVCPSIRESVTNNSQEPELNILPEVILPINLDESTTFTTSEIVKPTVASAPITTEIGTSKMLLSQNSKKRPLEVSKENVQLHVNKPVLFSKYIQTFPFRIPGLLKNKRIQTIEPKTRSVKVQTDFAKNMVEVATQTFGIEVDRDIDYKRLRGCR